jgi:hypothetical protein
VQHALKAAASMKEYRVYIFDYGHVNASHSVMAADDADAIEQAKAKYLADNDLEVWEDRRFVVRLKPGG